MDDFIEEVTIPQEQLDDMKSFLENECPAHDRMHFSASIALKKYDQALFYMAKIRG
jgi:hypothetical protein